MTAAAAPSGASCHRIWTPEESQLLLDAERKAFLVGEKLSQLFQSIMHSFLMVAKYPDLDLAQNGLHPIAPFSKPMQATIDLALGQKRQITQILENLISPEPSAEKHRIFKNMIDLERLAPRVESYFILYVLFETIYVFVEKHMKDLRKPPCNKAILGFVSDHYGTREELLREEVVKGQLSCLKGLMAKLEPVLVPENLKECITQIEACKLLLSPLEKVFYTAATVLYPKQQGDYREKIRRLWSKELQKNQALEKIADAFFHAPIEGRFTIAIEIINTKAISNLPGDIRMAIWRCIAENDTDSIYLGYFKNQVLEIAQSIIGIL